MEKAPVKKIRTKAKKAIPAPRDWHTIDATGQAVGRLATQVSILLRAKDRPDFQKHVDKGSNVVVQNVSKMTFSGKKLEQKEYFHYSGYPGGLKRTPLKKLFNDRPAEVLRKAVWNMLPKNKLRDKMIKRLTINK